MRTTMFCALAITLSLASVSAASAASSNALPSGGFTTDIKGNTTITVHQGAQIQAVIGSNNHAIQGAGTIYSGTRIEGNTKITVIQGAQIQAVIGSNNTANQQAGSIGAPVY